VSLEGKDAGMIRAILCQRKCFWDSAATSAGVAHHERSYNSIQRSTTQSSAYPGQSFARPPSTCECVFVLLGHVL